MNDDAVVLTASLPLSATWLKPGARNSSFCKFQPPSIAVEVAAEFAQRSCRRARPRRRSTPISIGIARDGRRRRRSIAPACAAPRPAAAACRRRGQHVVEIEARRVELGAERRRLAEIEAHRAGQLQRLLVRAVDEFAVLQQRRIRARGELAAQVPRLGASRAQPAAAAARLRLPSNFGLPSVKVSVPSLSMLNGCSPGCDADVQLDAVRR